LHIVSRSREKTKTKRTTHHPTYEMQLCMSSPYSMTLRTTRWTCYTRAISYLTNRVLKKKLKVLWKRGFGGYLEDVVAMLMFWARVGLFSVFFPTARDCLSTINRTLTMLPRVASLVIRSSFVGHRTNAPQPTVIVMLYQVYRATLAQTAGQGPKPLRAEWIEEVHSLFVLISNLMQALSSI
jgi:hypothetical protein